LSPQNEKKAHMSSLPAVPLTGESSFALATLSRMEEREYHADFALDSVLKDLELAAFEAGSGIASVASAIADRWWGLVHNGGRGLDVSAAAICHEVTRVTGEGR
jgi:3-hydroxyisobutyrate dehydrogenase-like beta-hydroxyacid dehydrogenase